MAFRLSGITAPFAVFIPVLLAACTGAVGATAPPTLVPSSTATPRPSATVTSPAATATPTATPISVTLAPLLGESIAPPFDIALPDGWRSGFDTLVMSDVDGPRAIPFAVYTGPVTGGTGTIVMLWGFPNLAGGNLLVGTVEPDLWVDGLRLLRLAVIGEGCNVGTDLRRNYVVGGLPAVGTQFAAVDCPDLPDTRGWFAGLRERNLNFIFYVYTDPIGVMEGGARAELQAVLDTVQFRVPAADGE